MVEVVVILSCSEVLELLGCCFDVPDRRLRPIRLPYAGGCPVDCCISVVFICRYSPEAIRLVNRAQATLAVVVVGTDRMPASRATNVAPIVENAADFPSRKEANSLCLVDRITGDVEWTDEAAEAATRVVAAAPPPLSILSARAALGLVAALRGEADTTGEQYQFLQQYQGIVLPGILRSMDRLLGILSQSFGELEQATTHFEDALAFCRKAGYRPELAWTCCDCADNLLQRDETGDRENAMALLDESLAISTDLGMRPLTERVISRRESLDGKG